EKLLQAMWNHAKRLRQDGAQIDLVRPIEDFWGADAPSTHQFLTLEEYTVLSQIQAWTGHRDHALNDLARRFLNRQGFAAIDAPRYGNVLVEDLTEWESELKKLVSARGYRPPELYALKDDLETRIYESYYPEKEKGEQ